MILEFFYGVLLERPQMKGGASERAAREGDPLNTTISNFDQHIIAVRENIFNCIFSKMDWYLKTMKSSDFIETIKLVKLCWHKSITYANIANVREKYQDRNTSKYTRCSISFCIVIVVADKGRKFNFTLKL